MEGTTEMDKNWWEASAQGIPNLLTETTGPKSKALHAGTERYMKGLSEQVKLFPAAFEEGCGIMLKDVDGKGGTAPCDTWDNALLVCKAMNPKTGHPFGNVTPEETVKSHALLTAALASHWEARAISLIA